MQGVNLLVRATTRRADMKVRGLRNFTGCVSQALAKSRETCVNDKPAQIRLQFASKSTAVTSSCERIGLPARDGAQHCSATAIKIPIFLTDRTDSGYLAGIVADTPTRLG